MRQTYKLSLGDAPLAQGRTVGEGVAAEVAILGPGRTLAPLHRSRGSAGAATVHLRAVPPGAARAEMVPCESATVMVARESGDCRLGHWRPESRPHLPDAQAGARPNHIAWERRRELPGTLVVTNVSSTGQLESRPPTQLVSSWTVRCT